MATETDRARELARVKQTSAGLTTFRVPEHVRTAHSHEGAIVLDILHGQIFGLNFVASRILELLKQGLELPAIAEQLAHEFETEPATVEADLYAFLESLLKLRLVTAQNEDSLT